MFDVNGRSAIAFREIGKGNESILNFARCMNMKALTWRAYNRINKLVADAYEQTANESMQEVTTKVKLNDNVQKHGDPVCCLNAVEVFN